MVSGTYAEDNFLVRIDSANKLFTAGELDYETNPVLNLRIRSTDAGGQSIERTFQVNVSDVDFENLAPIISSTSDYEVTENQTLVATISATDPDGDSLTYSILEVLIPVNSPLVLSLRNSPSFPLRL